MRATLKAAGLLALITLYGASVYGMTADSLGQTDIHGFISQGYMKSTDGVEFLSFGTADGTFEFNELGLNFSNEPAENLRVGMQFFAFDLGELGNDEIVLDWAYADYKIWDSLGLRAGLIRIPYGLHNETRDVDMLRTSILLPTSIYTELFRDLLSRFRGAGAYGDIFGRLSYQVCFGTTSIQTDGQLSTTINDFLDIDISGVDIEYAFGGHLLLETPLDGLRIGTSTIALSQMDMDARSNLGSLPLDLNFDYTRAYNGFIDYNLGDLTVSSEFTQYDVKAAVTNDAGSLNIPFVTTMIGYYGSLAYRFTDWMELGTYYSEYYWDRDDKDGEKIEAHPLINKGRERAWLKDTCLSVRFDINASWIAKLETHLMNGTFMAVGDENARNWQFYAAKMTYSF